MNICANLFISNGFWSQKKVKKNNHFKNYKGLPLSRIFQCSSVKALQKLNELGILRFYFNYEGQIIIFQSIIIFSFTKNNVMGTYTIIETRGEQLRVEPRRFYDVCHFTPSKPYLLGPNAKILIYWVLMIRHGSMINIGHPWLRGGIIKGQILHSCFGDTTRNLFDC